MKKIILVTALALLGSPFAKANIEYSIEAFTELMEETKAQVGHGYSIESMSSIYSQEHGHGFRIVLKKLLGINNIKCYRAIPKPFGTESRLELSEVNCSEE